MEKHQLETFSGQMLNISSDISTLEGADKVVYRKHCVEREIIEVVEMCSKCV